ncbi:MAG: hypothetical protein CMB56_003515 [Methanobacteriota archaeon]|nr:MAG: hypothetical protein CMB56_003515 [Euryarchaeota archaeon]
MCNICPSGNMGQVKLSSLVVIILIFCSLFSLISVVRAAEVEGITFTSESITITPENPVSGTPISIDVILNNSNLESKNVDVYFYKNQFEVGGFDYIKNINLPASDGILDSQTTVSQIWQDIDINDQGVYVEILDLDSGSKTAPVFKPFTVQGLPDLIVENVEITPQNKIIQGELFFVNVTIHNQGSLLAGLNSVSLNIEGSTISLTEQIETVLDTSSSKIVSFDAIAPQTGTWTIQISVDSNFEINELDDNNNYWTGDLIVIEAPDLYFDSTISLTTENGGIASVFGPWELSATIVATGTNVEDLIGKNIPIEITLLDEGGTASPVIINENIEWDADSNKQEMIFAFDSDDFEDFRVGVNILIIRLIPSEINIIEDNDVAVKGFEIAENPNIAIKIVDSIETGFVENNLSMMVSIENTGIVNSSGILTVNWKGESYANFDIELSGNEEKVEEIKIETGTSKGDFEFEVVWTPDSTWMDANNLDNSDKKIVEIKIPFILNFDLYSLNITPSQPYVMGIEHTLQININSTDTGNQTVECRDKENLLLNTKEVTIKDLDSQQKFECIFTPEDTGLYELKLIFVQKNGNDYTHTLQINPPESLLKLENEDSTDFLILLIPFTIFLIIALIAAIILTRKDTDLSNVIYVEIENNGYDPRELNITVGDKVMWTNYDEENIHTVSAKSLNEEGKLLFHSGDLQDHDEFLHEFKTIGSYEYGCKYNSKYYGKINVYGLEEDDGDEIIKGSTKFASEIIDMGFNEDELETDWDEKIVVAEAEVEQIRSKQEAELIEEEEIKLDTEEENIKMKIDDEDSELISQRGKVLENMDQILASKGELKSLKDEDVEFTASDASMRAELYALTGEEGVMPGDEVKIGLGSDKDHLEGKADFVGNELPNIETDFTFEESEKEINIEEKKNVETAECGGCGTEIPIDATSCQICGARFE